MSLDHLGRVHVERTRWIIKYTHAHAYNWAWPRTFLVSFHSEFRSFLIYYYPRSEIWPRWKRQKIACIGMRPWMYFLDLQCLYMLWTTGLTTVFTSHGHDHCFILYHSTVSITVTMTDPAFTTPEFLDIRWVTDPVCYGLTRNSPVHH